MHDDCIPEHSLTGAYVQQTSNGSLAFTGQVSARAAQSVGAGNGDVAVDDEGDAVGGLESTRASGCRGTREGNFLSLFPTYPRPRARTHTHTRTRIPCPPLRASLSPSTISPIRTRPTFLENRIKAEGFGMHARVFEYVDRDLSLRMISARASYRGRKGKTAIPSRSTLYSRHPSHRRSTVSVYKETSIVLAKDKRVYTLSRALAFKRLVARRGALKVSRPGC